MFIGDGKSLSEIKEAFNLEGQDAGIHLGMLETALCIKRSEKNGEAHYLWTPFGEE